MIYNQSSVGQLLLEGRRREVKAADGRPVLPAGTFAANSMTPYPVFRKSIWQARISYDLDSTSHIRQRARRANDDTGSEA